MFPFFITLMPHSLGFGSGIRAWVIAVWHHAVISWGVAVDMLFFSSSVAFSIVRVISSFSRSRLSSASCFWRFSLISCVVGCLVVLGVGVRSSKPLRCFLFGWRVFDASGHCCCLCRCSNDDRALGEGVLLVEVFFFAPVRCRHDLYFRPSGM